MKDPLTEDLAAIRRFRAQRLKELLRERDATTGMSNRRPCASELRSCEGSEEEPASGLNHQAREDH
jgi:hypothetical protein